MMKELKKYYIKPALIIKELSYEDIITSSEICTELCDYLLENSKERNNLDIYGCLDNSFDSCAENYTLN